MTKYSSFFRWAGGALFALSIAGCVYSFVVVWGRAAAFSSRAAAVDTALFAVFAAHHSVFAREPVQRWLARLVPAPLLRSVYVWIASALLIVVCAVWQPVGAEVYQVHGWRAVAHAAAQIAGLLIVVRSVRTIDVLELAGIRPRAAVPSLQIAGPYRWVRHPLYLGWLLATWSAAHMTGDRLVFSGISAIYLLMAIPWEERSLRDACGESYAQYQRQVRWRIVPYVY